jgi:hypothetical protein
MRGWPTYNLGVKPVNVFGRNQEKMLDFQDAQGKVIEKFLSI